MPTFSVVIAAYQVAGFIGEAVASALAQTRPPEEIVVWDDGSTDGLNRALLPYNDQIVLLHGTHRGVGAAKDAGTRAASGDFVVILDADDVFLPTRLARLEDLARARPDLDLLTTDAYVEVGGEVTGRYSDTFIAFAGDDQRRRILERSFLFPHVAIRRERLLAIGGFDGSLRSGVDWDCWLRLILDGSEAGCVNEPLSRYRIREGSVTSDAVTRARGHVRVLEKAAENPKLTAEERELVARNLLERRRQAVLTETEAVLRGQHHDGRRRALAIAFARTFPRRTRLKAGLSAIAPRAAARFVTDREERIGVTRLGRPVGPTRQGRPDGTEVTAPRAPASTPSDAAALDEAR